MENLNLVELLRDCPQGMELYSTIYGTVYFKGVRDTGNAVLIYVKTSCNTEVQFYPDGKFNTYYSDSEMTLFPSKDVRTWEGFQRPFKNGDIVISTLGSIAIVSNANNSELYNTYCVLYEHGGFIIGDTRICIERFATEEEKQKLFEAIKDNGYRWNAETKTLEKLIEPKFKVGDRIKYKNGKNKDGVEEGIILSITDDTYDVAVTNDMGIFTPVTDQDNWELIPDKFDIDTLKPFEDKVLVRNDESQRWLPAFWGYKVVDGFITTFGWCKYCIPYKGNEILFKTNDDCNPFFKTWEK